MVDPIRIFFHVSVQRIEQVHFLDLLRQSPAHENERDHPIGAAVTADDNGSDILCPNFALFVQFSSDICHKSAKSVRLLELSAIRIRSILRTLRYDKDCVLSALEELFRKLELSEHRIDGIVPPMNVHNDVERSVLAISFGNEDANGAVLIMLPCGERNSAVGVARIAQRIGKRGCAQ